MKYLILLGFLASVSFILNCQDNQTRPNVSDQFVVMIDPAHGGPDPGFISSNWIFEKDIVLQITKKLASQLEKGGFKVLLTRSADHFLSIQERIQLVKKIRPAVFISLHTNATKDSSKQGLYTYYQADNPQSILLDSLFHTVNRELAFMSDNGSQPASFYILTQSPAPSLMIDVGYLSNPAESTRLTDSCFQEQIARVIHEALVRYHSQVATAQK